MKILLSLLLLFPTSWFSAAPAVAQDTSSQEQQCRSALSAAEDLLVNGRRLWIVDVSTDDVGEIYVNYPYQSPVGLGIVIDGDATSDVMTSPRLLTTITETIRSGCPTVGLVTFAAAESDWAVDFGLIGNQVREFECIDPDLTDNLIRWGYTVCI
jgi:hypothetical protein